MTCACAIDVLERLMLMLIIVGVGWLFYKFVSL